MAGHFSGKTGNLYNTSPKKIREYLREIDGNFQVKDFRTHIGTREALKAIGSMRIPKTTKERRKATLTVTKRVSKVLGNTPSVAKSSYIAPEVWSYWG